LKTIVRGSQIPFEDTKVLRFFLWWKEESGYRTDIDLSANMFNKDWKNLGHISYTNLKGMGCYHSGDIISAPDGACEFIDITLDSLRNKGCRYVAMIVYSFTAQPFITIPECFAGWMVRNKPNSGKIFEPRTVKNKIDLANGSRNCIPMFIDIVENKIIWADMIMTNKMFLNNVESSKNTAKAIGESIVNPSKTNLYDLFNLHVQARNGKLIDKKDEADVVFSVDDGITPYDIDTIVSEYL